MKAQILLLFALSPLLSCGQDTQSSQTAANTEARQPLSTEYMRKAISFIRQVKGRELADSEFILADNAVSVNSNQCLQYALADKQFYSPVEVKLIENYAASWQQQWKKTDFPTVNFVKQDTVTAIFKNFLKTGNTFISISAVILMSSHYLYLFEMIPTAYSILLIIVEAFVVGAA